MNKEIEKLLTQYKMFKEQSKYFTFVLSQIKNNEMEVKKKLLEAVPIGYKDSIEGLLG